jgi:hypothetical protein
MGSVLRVPTAADAEFDAVFVHKGRSRKGNLIRQSATV